MKYIVLILLLIGCVQRDPAPTVYCQQGYVAGYWQTYRCATRVQFNAGSNVDRGGTARFNLYTKNRITVCSDCK